MTDIIELVLEDHQAVAALFDKLQAATSADDQTALYAQAKDALERHASAEEKVLYPRVRKEVPEGKEESKDAIEEHDQIRESLKEVEEHDAGSRALHPGRCAARSHDQASRRCGGERAPSRLPQEQRRQRARRARSQVFGSEGQSPRFLTAGPLAVGVPNPPSAHQPRSSEGRRTQGGVVRSIRAESQQQVPTCASRSAAACSPRDHCRRPSAESSSESANGSSGSRRRSRSCAVRPTGPAGRFERAAAVTVCASSAPRPTIRMSSPCLCRRNDTMSIPTSNNSPDT